MKELINKLKVADVICAEADIYFKKAKSIEQDIKTWERRKSKILTVAYGSTIPVIGLLSLFLSLENDFIIPICILIIPVILIHRALNKKVKGLYQNKANEEAAGIKIIQANADKLMFLPEDYWYALCTNYLLKILQSGRASDLNQALNMFDEQLHRWKVEEANAQIIAEQERQSKQLDAIKDSAQLAAFNSFFR